MAPAGPAGWLQKLWCFLVFSVSKAQDDNLPQQSAALAFTTMVSLVPLLAAFATFGNRWFYTQESSTVELLSSILPYSEDLILTQLQIFLDQAQSIRGFGFAFFLLAAMAVFTTIEHSINQIWQVPSTRPLSRRLMSLVLVLFCGPILIASPHVLLYEVRRSPIRTWADSLPAEFLPFATTLLGLTMLYWLVPYTNVRFRSALAGGFGTTLVLEGLRWGFALYVERATNISLVYGSFGLLFLFMVSINLTWYIILLGAEMAYSVQNFEFMVRRRRAVAPAEGSWVGLAALAFVAYRFRQGEPITPHEVLAKRLRMEVRQLQRALVPLLEAGLLRETGGRGDGYLLSRDPHDLELAEIFRLYEPLQWEFLELLPPRLAARLEELRERLTKARRKVTAGEVVATLAEDWPEEGEPESEPEGASEVPRRGNEKAPTQGAGASRRTLNRADDSEAETDR